MTRKSNLIRYFCIFLCIVLAASLFLQLEDIRVSPSVPTVENIPGDADDNTGEDTTLLYAWCKSPEEHTEHTIYSSYLPFYCPGCDISLYSLDEINTTAVESCSYATCYYGEITCVYCNSPIEQTNVVIACCYINGVCHVCGKACDHICNVLDYCYFNALPSDHPLHKGAFPFEADESYVINGQCTLCYLPVEN